MLKELLIVRLFKQQNTKQIILSFLLGFIYFILPTGVAILLVVNFVLLYYYYLLYFLVLLLMVTSYLSFHANDRIIETLQNYEFVNDFYYDLFLKRLNVFGVVFLFIAHTVAYFIIINF